MKFKHISLIGAGSTLEIFDSYIFGFMLVQLNQIFFPEALHMNLASLATFSILFVVRPISAFFWGISGDKYGKFLVFKHAILFMAIATILIGLLPTYNQAGIIAPLLLLGLRIVQGISISGEFGSAVVLCYEQSDLQKKFSTNGILYVFIFGGILMAGLITYGINKSGINSDLAWRIPFIFGGAGGLIIYFIRRNISFIENNHLAVDFKLVIKNYKIFLIGGCALFLINLNWLYFSAIFSIFGKITNIDNIGQLSIKCSLVVMISVFIFGKYLAYRMRNHMMMVLFFSIIAMYSIGIFLVNYTELATAMMVFYYIESILAGIIFVSMPIMVVSIFPDVIRNSIYNIATNISAAMMIGLMPFFIHLLDQNFKDNWLTYLLISNMVISLISLLCVRLLRNIQYNSIN